MPLLLVVDDDDDILLSLRQVLEDEGFDVLTARNGAEALDILQRNIVPHGIILDLMMPRMDGWDFLAAVQTDANLIEIPIILMTAVPSVKCRSAAGGGARIIVQKPFNVETMIRIIRHLT
jgi:CheY-like chemotaxis protein